jgi:hypothetical protein
MEKGIIKGSFVIVMVVFTQEIGLKIKCKAKESFIMPRDDWHTKEIFSRTNSTDKELSLMKTNRCY